MDRGPGVPPPPRHQLVGGSRGSSSGSLGAHIPGADGSSEDLHALGKREKVKDKVKRYIRGLKTEAGECIMKSDRKASFIGFVSNMIMVERMFEQYVETGMLKDLKTCKIGRAHV